MMLRKLGYCELIYDYELLNKTHLLAGLLKFSSSFDLFEKRSLLEIGIRKWIQLNPFLRTRIVKNDSIKHLKNKSFVINDEPIELSNVKYFRLEIDSSRNMSDSIRLVYERELNLDPIDPSRDLLWRLSLVRIECIDKSDASSPNHQYLAILQIHHAITDGLNLFYKLKQLVDLFRELFTDSDSKAVYQDQDRDELGKSIDDLVFREGEEDEIEMAADLSVLNSCKCKVPNYFASKNPNCESTKYQDSLIELMSDGSERLICEIHEQHETKFLSFCLSEHTLTLIKAKSREHDFKLATYFNFMFALALHKAHIEHGKEHEEFYENYSNKLSCHLMVSLRPHLNIGNEKMGIYSSVVDVELDLSSCLQFENDATFWSSRLWTMVSSESSRLHRRLLSNEHVENAKSDFLLYRQLIGGETFPNGGGVDYAMSNVGQLDSVENETNETTFKLDEYYYQVSMQENRWSSVIFNGISTLNDRVNWGVTFNSRHIRTDIMEYIIENVIHFVSKSLKSVKFN